MDDFDDSFGMEPESDGFSPEKPVKKTSVKKTTTAKTTAPKKSSAQKKTAAPKADKPKAAAKPRAKKPKITEDVDEGVSFEREHSFAVLETPQLSSDGPSPPRPTVLQEQNAGGSKKNASDTYQKVFSQ